MWEGQRSEAPPAEQRLQHVSHSEELTFVKSEQSFTVLHCGFWLLRAKSRQEKELIPPTHVTDNYIY